MKYISKRYCKKAVFFWSNAIDTNSWLLKTISHLSSNIRDSAVFFREAYRPFFHGQMLWLSTSVLFGGFSRRPSIASPVAAACCHRFGYLRISSLEWCSQGGDEWRGAVSWGQCRFTMEQAQDGSWICVECGGGHPIRGLKVESYLYTTHFRLLGPNSSRMKLKWNFVEFERNWFMFNSRHLTEDDFAVRGIFGWVGWMQGMSWGKVGEATPEPLGATKPLAWRMGCVSSWWRTHRLIA